MTTFRSLKKTQQAIASNIADCESITKSYLQEIKKNRTINAFIEVFEKEAIDSARKIDKKIKLGQGGKLAGMVLGIKDNICYRGHKSTASSKMLENFHSLYSATVIERVLKEDAIIIGRLNCDEFAMGSSNENTIYGAVKNPINNNKVAGGSSGGSAAAVSAGLCLAALGSDTGGSIRQPASFCGVVGLKPTYSRVSRYGLIAYASSFDQIGPITNNVDDASIILEVIAGEDIHDGTASKKIVENYSEIKKNNKNKRIGYISECLEREGVDVEVKKFIQDRIKKLKQKGHTVEPVSFPYLDFLIPTYYVLSTAEASSNLARFDGVHYGYRDHDAKELESVYFNSRTSGFGEEVKRRIMLGTFVLSSGYHEAFFTKAQKIRRLIQNATNKMFKEYDFIISPTTPHTAFDIDREYSDPTQMYLEDIFTVQANLSGNPAITLPLAFHSNGLPMGLHLMSSHFNELELLSFSKQLYPEN